MQEEQTVSFEPMDAGYFPWFAKLFALYLLLVLLIILVRGARMIWVLWKLRKGPAQRTGESSQAFWMRIRSSAAGFRRLSHLTLLLNSAVLAGSLAETSRSLSFAKTPSIVFWVRRLADPLGTFTMGLLVCAVLYLCGMVFETAILRRQCRVELDQPNPQTSQAR